MNKTTNKQKIYYVAMPTDIHVWEIVSDDLNALILELANKFEITVSQMLRDLFERSHISIYQCTEAFYSWIRSGCIPQEYYLDKKGKMCTKEEQEKERLINIRESEQSNY